MADCIQEKFGFQDLGGKKVEADFSGGHLSSDGGILLVREVDQTLQISEKLSKCFNDYRDMRYVEHPLEIMIAQRMHGLALGYEDINDHERLRYDPLFAASCGQSDILGERRSKREDKGKALAGKSTLNRLELGADETDGHYRKIQANASKIESLLVKTGVASIPRQSRVIVLDFDATDDPIHGAQEGRFFHGYYGNYCYLPLYCFCEEIPLWAELREANQDGSAGTQEALEKIVKSIRERLGKQVKIIVRADSGFCRENLMSWIEAEPNVHYCIGLARNKRLQKQLEPTFDLVREELGHEELRLCALGAGAKEVPNVEGTARAFSEFEYTTLDTWSRLRRVIGKAEITNGKVNPRFIVTDLTGHEDWAHTDSRFESATALYENFYCARGDMENRIKEQQLDLFADRTSTRAMASNQLRLWLSTFAYFLLTRLREIALKETRFANATPGSIRVHLMKIAAQVCISTRRLHVRLASACPCADVFAHAHEKLLQYAQSAYG